MKNSNLTQSGLTEGADICISCDEAVSESHGIRGGIVCVCAECSLYYRAIDMEVNLLPYDAESRVNLMRSRLRNEEFMTVLKQQMAREKISEIAGALDYYGVDSLKMAFASLADVDKYLEKEGFYPGALCLRSALGCMNEEQRVLKFLDGLTLALKKLESEMDEDIEMVDAGSGPVPLFACIAALKSERVNVTCLELNKASANMSRDIIEKLGLSDRVKVISTDATFHKHDKAVDLLISETMYSGLLYELQVQILRNMVPQVKKEGIVIPEWITVDAALVSLDDSYNSDCNLKEVKRITRDSLAGAVDFVLEAPEDGVYLISVGSRVCIFDALEISSWDSVITRPVDLLSLDLKKGNKVSVFYEPGTDLDEVSINVE